MKWLWNKNKVAKEKAKTVFDAYEWLVKNKKLNSVDKETFVKVVYEVNKRLAERVVNGEKISFLSGVGDVLPVHFERKIWTKENGTIKDNFAIDVKETFALWREDKEAKAKRKLIKKTLEKDGYMLIYECNRSRRRIRPCLTMTFCNALKKAFNRNIENVKGKLFDKKKINKEK